LETITGTASIKIFYIYIKKPYNEKGVKTKRMTKLQPLKGSKQATQTTINQKKTRLSAS
jgi:hypothetical protein